MTKKDYIAISDLIRETREDLTANATIDANATLELLINRLCYVFGRDNARFDSERFREACRNDS